MTIVELMIGDLDKPFHRPECACEQCEGWRQKKGRPTRKELWKKVEKENQQQTVETN